MSIISIITMIIQGGTVIAGTAALLLAIRCARHRYWDLMTDNLYMVAVNAACFVMMQLARGWGS